MSAPDDRLPPPFRAYVEALLEHAAQALWPERRAALESFYRGIAGSAPDDLRLAAEALDLESGPEADVAALIFRRVLTAYLAHLDEPAVTSPDQAHLYGLSLDPNHVALADRWLASRADPAGKR